MSTPTTKVAFHTMGCKTNFSDTSTISNEMLSHGYQKVSYKEEADIYVLNTCSVTENADKEARKLIRQARRRNPYAKIAVIGCYAQLQPDQISNIAGVDLVLGASEKFNLLTHLNSLNDNNESKIVRLPINQNNSFQSSFTNGERTRSYLKIQDGCNYNCSFCTIPLARGRSRSDTIENTVKIAQNIADSGAKEIVLTGINIGDFGSTNNENFFQLIKTLDNLKGIERFRISSIEPNLLSNDIISFCANSNKFVPHFHIPLQSGSDSILQSMKRRYNTDLYKSRVEHIKKIIPDCCIGVDVIVGYPGEKEDHFEQTYSFIESMDVSYLHVFSYSKRKDTFAASLNDQVTKERKEYRSKALHHLSNKKKKQFYNQYINKIRPVLVEQSINGKIQGFTDNYIKVNVDQELSCYNKIISVLLNENKGNYMQGEII
ncbi:MAG: tRNA (N(6)-L-threonylcarbamoyladenosine(37)-C(2))-methylthiotransferase MtaB [Candidatus Neomarinimicrobiota bacterium]|nr:tRNA (N(6)-L-threonylcarbamoyladenosine(37)-C(2))-methylthiotransferase MtaB [Candidatus Neomarinimicrobiota bacterium]